MFEVLIYNTMERKGSSEMGEVDGYYYNGTKINAMRGGLNIEQELSY